MLAEAGVEQGHQVRFAQLGERDRAVAGVRDDRRERFVGGSDDRGVVRESRDERDAGAPLGERVPVDKLLDAGGDRGAGEDLGGGAARSTGALHIALLVDREAVVGHLRDPLDAFLRRVPDQLVALRHPIEVEVEEPARIDRARAADLHARGLALRPGLGDVDGHEELGIDHGGAR